MTAPDDEPSTTQHNHQINHATNGGSIYSTQHGDQSISNTYNTINKPARTWTGWAILVMFVLDVAFFFYGKEAYTAEAGNSGDLWRAGIFLVLVGITGSLIRRWFRLHR